MTPLCLHKVQSWFTTRVRHQAEVRPSGLSTFQVCGPWAQPELYLCFEITPSLHLFAADQSGPVRWGLNDLLGPFRILLKHSVSSLVRDEKGWRWVRECVLSSIIHLLYEMTRRVHSV